MNTWAIFAEMIAEKDESVLNERLLWATGALVGVLLVGAIVLAMIERWRKRQLSDPTGEADSLTHYREMYSRGEITKEEYQHIRSKLAEQYLDTAGKPAPGGDDGSAPPKADQTEPEA